MKEIEELLERIEEEYGDAENYAWKASNYKDKDNELSRTYAELSREEISHAERLCAQGERIIKKLKEKDEHNHMIIIWDWYHKHAVARKHEVKNMLTNI